MTENKEIPSPYQFDLPMDNVKKPINVEEMNIRKVSDTPPEGDMKLFMMTFSKMCNVFKVESYFLTVFIQNKEDPNEGASQTAFSDIDDQRLAVIKKIIQDYEKDENTN